MMHPLSSIHSLPWVISSMVSYFLDEHVRWSRLIAFQKKTQAYSIGSAAVCMNHVVG